MADPFRTFADKVSDPATRAVAIVPNDGTDLADIPKAFYVGTGGTIAMIGAGAPAGATGVTWKNVPSGAIVPFRPRRILATGTTAADMLALY
ncbi:spike base protein, RCAP_Rcc01079 family [Sphingomonas sp. Leaf257]|uniref:spike base protein, RCAP_Rcc01079 family n=1 Tax=Sphingomonas sp. Leaf257 TaxID=1736309 RepID=UPI0006F3BD87|nr:hypothetical protein [Sphingomonas sp. Leaf257]KQO51156.1 hypothetical protein ASF14_09855 [Sphingomonas sp. Leaf257]